MPKNPKHPPRDLAEACERIFKLEKTVSTLSWSALVAAASILLIAYKAAFLG